MKKFISLVFALVLCSCASMDTRVEKEHYSHPGLEVFLTYEKAVSSAPDFLSLLPHFSKRDHTRIKDSIGWARLSYSASHQALSQGACDKIYLSKITFNRVIVNCEGAFTFKSAFGFQSQETMHLKVYVKRMGENWFISRSGLEHSMPGKNGQKGVPRKVGLNIK